MISFLISILIAGFLVGLIFQIPENFLPRIFKNIILGVVSLLILIYLFNHLYQLLGVHQTVMK